MSEIFYSIYFRLSVIILALLLLGFLVFSLLNSPDDTPRAQNLLPAQNNVVDVQPSLPNDVANTKDNKAVAQPGSQNPQSQTTRIEEWNALEFSNGITVSDCLQCDEDIAVMLSCTKNSGTLSAQLPWLAFENGVEDEKVTVTFTIDNLAYVRLGRLKNIAVAGFVPEVLLYTNDPILEQIASGEELSFFMLRKNGTTSNGPVALNGSRKAINKLREVCDTPSTNRG